MGRRRIETHLYKEFEAEDPEKFFQAFRMSKETFDNLLDVVFPYIRKQDTSMRLAIPAKTRLQVYNFDAYW